MGYLITILILITIYTLYMGYTDGSNAVATCITTKAIPPRFAIYLSATIQFGTVIAMYFLVKDLSVAATIGSGILDANVLNVSIEKEGFLFLFSALLSAILWSAITYFLKQPNSTSHTLLGGIIGAGIASFGFSSVLWDNVLIRIVLMIFLAPVISLVIGFMINKLLRRIARHASLKMGKAVKTLQWFNVALLSSAISINDAQKAIGIYLLIATFGIGSASHSIPLGLVFLFASALALGMILGGYRVIITIGRKLFKIKPLMSLSSQIATNIVIFSSSALGVPISTGQVISSTVVGIGVSERVGGVRWLTVRKIVIGWLITLPATIAFGAIIYYIVKYTIGGLL